MPTVSNETRDQHNVLLANLENERSTFIAHWRELGEYLLPRRTRFFISDANKGDKRHNKIIDSSATIALRTLQSGMMSGVTSPARQWFRLAVPDPQLAEFPPVKEWLQFVERNMSAVFTRSNLYNRLPTIYGDMGGFGTGAIFVEEDFKDVLRFYSLPIGSFMLSTNDRGQIDVFAREFGLTVREVVNKFGRNPEDPTKIVWDDISNEVKRAWDNHQHDQRVEVNHIIEPNPDWDPDRLGSEFMRYRSAYIERGISQNQGQSPLNTSGGVRSNQYLRVSGYDFFPVLAPRWEVSGQDIYGTNCPGMTALGDTKSLQLMHKRKAEAIEKMVKPPLLGSASLRQSKVSILPGDITYMDERSMTQGGLRPVFEVNLRISELAQDIQEHQFRIRRIFFEDLFLMLATIDRRQITAREIEERHEEKLLALGPVLEQMNQDLLDPLIDIAFNRMMAQGLIPDPPEEIQGQDLRVEYISPMAQAQKLISLGSVTGFAGFAGNIAAINPQSLDKVDTDQILDVYGEMVSLPPKILRSDEEVAAIREQRAEAQRQAQLAEALAQGASAAKDLSQADLSGESVLSNIANAGA